MIQVLQYVGAMVLTGIVFVLRQHGWANTLKAIGLRLYAWGAAHEARCAERKAEIDEIIKERFGAKPAVPIVVESQWVDEIQPEQVGQWR